MKPNRQVSFRSILFKAWFSQRERAIDRFRRRPAETQERIFRQLLRRGRGTEFGWRYDLGHVRSVEQFQSMVETFDYETFKPYIEKMLAGERNVTAPGRVKLFARSSGTTSDRSKYIPVTEESLWWNHTLGMRDVATVFAANNPKTKVFDGKTLTLGGSCSREGRNLVGDLSAVLIHETTFWSGWFRAPRTATAIIPDFDRKVEAIDFSKAADKFVYEVEDVEDAVEDFDTVLLSDTNTVEKLTFKNGTLYTDRNATKGFSVSPEVKVVLSLADKKGNEFDDVDDSYTGYNGLEKALRDMNAQGTFGTGVVEVSAILDNGVATSIVINDKAKAGSDVSNPTVPEGEFLPASWDSKNREVKLRYYKDEMTDSEIKAAIEDLLGAPVDRLNKFMGYVTLENGDMYSVDFTQIEVVAINLDGEIVAYKDAGVSGIDTEISGLKAGTLLSNGLVTARNTHTADRSGKITVKSTLNSDLDLYTVYQVTDKTSGAIDKMELKDEPSFSSGMYVPEGETLVVTVKAGYSCTISVDGDEEYIEFSDEAQTVEVEVTGTVVFTADEMTVVKDSQALNAAIAAGKETIVLGDGEYQLDTTITSDVTIIGNGKSVMKYSAVNVGAESALCANACTVTVSDVNFKSVSDGAWAIVTTGDADSIVKVYDCTFTGFDTPFYFNNGGGEIIGCTFTDCHKSSIQDLSSVLTVEDCRFDEGQNVFYVNDVKVQNMVKTDGCAVARIYEP